MLNGYPTMLTILLCLVTEKRIGEMKPSNFCDKVDCRCSTASGGVTKIPTSKSIYLLGKFYIWENQIVQARTIFRVVYAD